MMHQELTEKVIGCAYQVYNTMGFGYEEGVYERCMAIELQKVGLRADYQVGITVYYCGENVGEFSADMLVDGVLIVELKSVRALTPAHEAQLVNDLVATGKDVGLLLNFGEHKVAVKRRTRLLGQDGERRKE